MQNTLHDHPIPFPSVGDPSLSNLIFADDNDLMGGANSELQVSPTDSMKSRSKRSAR
ncbi:hypothetical protein DPMN_035082 [Dreissena polymorpha]|uniref:Uncharacterized protein n=1 Tax=Dreissena polymorpha TaxID=45954 RepID=A0A9D4M6M5_DREPO|nr:hypothetical protein DPMN_035082 [Dreissena polymorpha]